MLLRAKRVNNLKKWTFLLFTYPISALSKTFKIKKNLYLLLPKSHMQGTVSYGQRTSSVDKAHTVHTGESEGGTILKAFWVSTLWLCYLIGSVINPDSTWTHCGSHQVWFLKVTPSTPSLNFLDSGNWSRLRDIMSPPGVHYCKARVKGGKNVKEHKYYPFVNDR